jgi:proteasome lid subunit RPN8/RPN11
MDGVTLERAALDEILAHARATHPEECCGFVIRRDGRDVVRRLTNVQTRLHQEHPDEVPRDGRAGYTPDPKERIAAEREAEQPGASLKIIYHSHPVRGSYFSGEDRARAMFGDEPAYPDVVYVVVSDARLPGEARAFRWSDDARDFVETALEVR